MLKNDTLKNGTSRIGLYGSAPPPSPRFESTIEAALNSGDVPELKSTQDKDKHADFIVTAISTAVGKAIPTSKSESTCFRRITCAN